MNKISASWTKEFRAKFGSALLQIQLLLGLYYLGRAVFKRFIAYCRGKIIALSRLLRAQQRTLRMVVRRIAVDCAQLPKKCATTYALFTIYKTAFSCRLLPAVYCRWMQTAVFGLAEVAVTC